MDREPSMFAPLENKGEGIERQRRSEPHVAAAAPLEASAGTIG